MMPLSDHEQRMLDQIATALDAEDPKFASSVRGGTLRAPSARRRLKGALLFAVGLALLVAGVPLYTNASPLFLILSVVGFVSMFGGAVLAITGQRSAGVKDRVRDEAHSQTNSGKGPSDTFIGRMEDRFRRRFEE